MNDFYTIYNIIWSILATIIGFFALTFTHQFVARNVQAFELLYKRTNFSLFKKQAEQMGRPYVKSLVRFLGLFFIILGIFTLINNV